MAIGQSNMFSAPGDTQLGRNQQLSGVSQPTAPSMGMLDTTAPVGQTMNQMQQAQVQPQAQAYSSGQGLGGFNQFPPPFGGFQPPIQQPIQRPIGNFPPPFGGFQPPSIGFPPSGDPIGFRPPNPIMNPTPPMMPPGGGFRPPSIGFPPGGIGGFPPSFRPPGFRPPIGGLPSLPPNFRPPGFIGRPPIFGRPPNFRPPGFIGRPPIGRPPIGIGGLGKYTPALIEAITGGRPIGIGAQPPNLEGNTGLGAGITGLGAFGPAILGSNLFRQQSATPMSGGTPMPSLTAEGG